MPPTIAARFHCGVRHETEARVIAAASEPYRLTSSVSAAPTRGGTDGLFSPLDREPVRPRPDRRRSGREMESERENRQQERGCVLFVMEAGTSVGSESLSALAGVESDPFPGSSGFPFRLRVIGCVPHRVQCDLPQNRNLVPLDVEQSFPLLAAQRVELLM